jgi:hypothetical protein
MAETIIIPCPHCDTLNRLPAERRDERGKAGTVASRSSPASRSR